MFWSSFCCCFCFDEGVGDQITGSMARPNHTAERIIDNSLRLTYSHSSRNRPSRDIPANQRHQAMQSPAVNCCASCTSTYDDFSLHCKRCGGITPGALSEQGE